MAKTYTVKMAEAIKARLNEGHPFKILPDLPHWKGYIFVDHPNGANKVISPRASDMRKAPTPEAVEQALDTIRYGLSPTGAYTPEWQSKFREAHRAWLIATTVDEEEEN